MKTHKEEAAETAQKYCKYTLRNIENIPYDTLQAIVLAALHDCIKCHGPISLYWKGSAAKRVTRSILNKLKEMEAT